jgi:hypothetical protein
MNIQTQVGSKICSEESGKARTNDDQIMFH